MALSVSSARLRTPTAAMASAVDLYYAMPLEVLMRFGRWDDVMKEPAPPADFAFANAIHHYARGVALAAGPAAATGAVGAMAAGTVKVPFGTTPPPLPQSTSV